jgi:hypothetical protein
MIVNWVVISSIRCFHFGGILCLWLNGRILSQCILNIFHVGHVVVLCKHINCLLNMVMHEELVVHKEHLNCGRQHGHIIQTHQFPSEHGWCVKNWWCTRSTWIVSTTNFFPWAMVFASWSFGMGCSKCKYSWIGDLSSFGLGTN